MTNKAMNLDAAKKNAHTLEGFEWQEAGHEKNHRLRGVARVVCRLGVRRRGWQRFLPAGPARPGCRGAATGRVFLSPSYYYSGDASKSEELPFNGTADLGIDADIFIVMPTAIWVTPVNVFGGDLAFSGTYVYGKADLSAEAGIAIPLLSLRASVELNDDRWTAGDPVFSAFVGWHGENQHYLVAASVNIPDAGSDYDEGRLANVALNRWAGDITVAGTWMFPQENIELSGATGVTFNGKNDDTDYETGTEFHLEASVFYQFTKAFSAGVNGYHYRQISDDSGQGAALGSFKGRVTALGAGLSGHFRWPDPAFSQPSLFSRVRRRKRVSKGTPAG